MKFCLIHLRLCLIVVLVAFFLQGCDLFAGYFTSFEGGTRLVLVPENVNKENVDASTLGQAVNVINSRLDQYGVRKKSVQIIGGNKIEILLPVLKETERVKKILAQNGNIEFRFIKDGDDANPNLKHNKPGPSPVLDKNNSLEPEVLLDNSMIEDTELRINSTTDEPYLAIKFTDSGARKLFDVTSKGIGRKMAIVMDGKILGAPVIREAITEGQAMVNLPFSEQDTKNLQIVMNSGPYPVKLHVAEVGKIAESK